MKLASYTGFVKSSDPKSRDEYPCLTMPKAFVERSAKNCGHIVITARCIVEAALQAIYQLNVQIYTMSKDITVTL